jgi:glycosyltransferase involved in cell wall biosynthesis
MRLRSQPVDILFLMTGIPNIWGRILGRLTGVRPIVGACRDHILWHERFLGRLAHHHVCNSAAIRTYVAEKCGIPEKRTSVIHNGVDLERFFPLEGDAPQDPLILHVGRLVKDKDQGTLIAAFCRIAGDLPGAQLWMVGDGPLQGELTRMARETPFGDRIRLMPGQADIGSILRRAKVFALSSLRESLPNVVLEAMASGIPVVATHVGGLAEVVEPEKTGLLVPPASPPALANALKKLWTDPERQRAYGRAARRKMEEEFSFHRMVGRYDALFEDLLAQRVGPIAGG